jgi:phenylalanyl-tRNA synthetase beta chain
VAVPSHRLDLEREVDLIEELARVHGMDRIPAVLPRVAKSLDAIGQKDTRFDFAMGIKKWARGAGLREAINYSFCGQADLDLLGLPAEGRVAVINPLSEDQNVLRTALAPGLLANVRTNVAHGAARLRLFEYAHLFFADAASETTAREPARLGLLVYGRRRAERWPWPGEDSADYADLKGLVEHLLTHLGLPGAGYTLREGHSYLAPCVEVRVDGRAVGVLGRVTDAVADRYDARARSGWRSWTPTPCAPCTRLWCRDSRPWPSSRPCAATLPSRRPWACMPRRSSTPSRAWAWTCWRTWS